jgi:hypothetical protein
MLLVAPVLAQHRVALGEVEQKTMAEEPDLRQRVTTVWGVLSAHEN